MKGSGDSPTDRDRDDIGCLAVLEMFYAYLDGEIEDPREIADLERHMSHCRSCFTRAEFEGLLNERLKALTGRRAPDRLKSRLHDLMSRF